MMIDFTGTDDNILLHQVGLVNTVNNTTTQYKVVRKHRVNGVHGLDSAVIVTPIDESARQGQVRYFYNRTPLPVVLGSGSITLPGSIGADSVHNHLDAINTRLGIALKPRDVDNTPFPVFAEDDTGNKQITLKTTVQSDIFSGEIPLVIKSPYSPSSPFPALMSLALTQNTGPINVYNTYEGFGFANTTDADSSLASFVASSTLVKANSASSTDDPVEYTLNGVSMWVHYSIFYLAAVNGTIIQITLTDTADTTYENLITTSPALPGIMAAAEDFNDVTVSIGTQVVLEPTTFTVNYTDGRVTSFLAVTQGRNLVEELTGESDVWISVNKE